MIGKWSNSRRFGSCECDVNTFLCIPNYSISAISRQKMHRRQLKNRPVPLLFVCFYIKACVSVTACADLSTEKNTILTQNANTTIHFLLSFAVLKRMQRKKFVASITTWIEIETCNWSFVAKGKYFSLVWTRCTNDQESKTKSFVCRRLWIQKQENSITTENYRFLSEFKQKSECFVCFLSLISLCCIKPASGINFPPRSCATNDDDNHGRRTAKRKKCFIEAW